VHPRAPLSLYYLSLYPSLSCLSTPLARLTHDAPVAVALADHPGVDEPRMAG